MECFPREVYLTRCCRVFVLKLPDELIFNIVGYLDRAAMPGLCLVSRSFLNAARQRLATDVVISHSPLMASRVAQALRVLEAWRYVCSVYTIQYLT
jgi:hypothetical protein